MGITENIQDAINRFGVSNVILLAIVIGLQIYFAIITNPVPNYNAQTQTVIYAAQDLVVPASITQYHVLLSSALIVFLFYSMSKQERTIDIISHDQAAQIILSDITKLQKNNMRFKDVKPTIINFHLNNRVVKDGNSLPHRYVFIIKLTSDESGEGIFYYRYEIHPYNARITTRIETERPLEESDICPHGNAQMSDFKIVTGSDLEQLKYVRKDMGYNL